MGSEAPKVCATEDLHWLCQIAKQVAEPHVDLSGLLGLAPGTGPSVGVDGLLETVVTHEEPAIVLSWDDKSLTLQRTSNGEFLGTFELKF